MALIPAELDATLAPKSEEPLPEPAESAEMYRSKDGFEEVPLLRGFTEIQNVYYAVNVHGGIICGGYARYCASPRKEPEPAADVDIYCKDEKCFEAIKAIFVDLSVKHENEISITYDIPESGPFAFSPTIQLIKPMLEGRVVSQGSVEEILSNFDFTIVRAAIVSPSTVLVDADFTHDEPLRLLRLKNIHCPISSTLRCMKYARRGYWLRPMQCVSLFIDWDGRDDEYRSKLLNYLEKANDGAGLSQEEVDELEALMRID